MNFDNITIILCRTSHPGNIGSTARAMQTMGFKKLCLVGPKIFPSAEATALAANAKEVLDNTKTCQNIEAALVNADLQGQLRCFDTFLYCQEPLWHWQPTPLLLLME